MNKYSVTIVTNTIGLGMNTSWYISLGIIDSDILFKASLNRIESQGYSHVLTVF